MQIEIERGRHVVSGQPTGSSTQLEEVDIDFRVSGLPHAVVKQAENSRVRELVKKIESHPHRQDLLADLQRSNAYNPFSEKSKKMIQDMSNVELFELCETFPKVQSSECLLYWNQGIVYCTCGHLLRDNQSSRDVIRWTLETHLAPRRLLSHGMERYVQSMLRLLGSFSLEIWTAFPWASCIWQTFSAVWALHEWIFWSPRRRRVLRRGLGEWRGRGESWLTGDLPLISLSDCRCIAMSLLT